MSFSLESILAPSPHSHAHVRHSQHRPPSPRGKTSATPSQNFHPHAPDALAYPENQGQQQYKYNPAFHQHHHHHRPHLHGQAQFQSQYHQVPPASLPPYRCPHSTSLAETGYGSVTPAQLLYRSYHTNSTAPPNAPSTLSHQNQTQPQSHPSTTFSQDRHHWTFPNFTEEDDSSEPYSEFTLDSPFPHEATNDENDNLENQNDDESETYSSGVAEEEEPDNPSINFGYGTSFLSNFIEPRPSNHSPHNILPPTMTPPRVRKRSIIQLDVEEGPSTSVTGAKRRRTSISQSNQRMPAQHSRSIEEVDLTAEDDPLNVTLQKQRAEAVQSQQQSYGSKNSKLSSLQCQVCLDTMTDLTATACGHTFCRSCLMNWLIAGEKEPQRRPNCPACRKPLRRTGKGDTIPLEIMKRPAR